MENNIDYEKLLADEAKARQEAEAASEAKAAAEREARLEKERELLERGLFDDYGAWNNDVREKSGVEKLNVQKEWLKKFLQGYKELYPFPDKVPDELAQWIADEWESFEWNCPNKTKSEKVFSSLPEQIQKIIKERQAKWEEQSKREEEERKEKERKQRESARWAWENGRKRRLLTDKTQLELLAMIELNLREISYWLEHYAFKFRRY